MGNLVISLENAFSYWTDRRTIATQLLSELSFVVQLVSIPLVVGYFTTLLISWVFSLFLGIYSTLVLQYVAKSAPDTHEFSRFDILYMFIVGQALFWIGNYLTILLGLILILISISAIGQEMGERNSEYATVLGLSLLIILLSSFPRNTVQQSSLIGLVSLLALGVLIGISYHLRARISKELLWALKIQIGFLATVCISGLFAFPVIDFLTQTYNNLPLRLVSSFSLYGLLLGGAIYILDILGRSSDIENDSKVRRDSLTAIRIMLVMIGISVTTATLILGLDFIAYIVVYSILSAFMTCSWFLFPIINEWTKTQEDWKLESLILFFLSGIFGTVTCFFYFISNFNRTIFPTTHLFWFGTIIVAFLISYLILAKWGLLWGIPSFVLVIIWLFVVPFSYNHWATVSVFGEDFIGIDFLNLIVEDPELFALYTIFLFSISIAMYALSILGTIASLTLVVAVRYCVCKKNGLLEDHNSIERWVYNLKQVKYQ